MRYRKDKIISPIKFFGAKYYLARRIIEKMQHRPSVFVEGFCCTSVISLNILENFQYHFCFDNNPWIIDFWKVLQYEPNRLYSFLLNTEYSEENFEQAKEYMRTYEDAQGDQFFNAAMFFVANRMSRSADMKSYGWSDRLRRGMPEYISAYKSAVESLPAVAERIKHINFRCGNYIDLMLAHNLHKCEDLVQYLDPPYLSSTRISRQAYGKYEMDDNQHKDLLDFVTRDCTGLTYISGYESPLYTSLLAGYSKYEWNVANSSGQTKKKSRRIETLWEVA